MPAPQVAPFRPVPSHPISRNGSHISNISEASEASDALQLVPSAPSAYSSRQTRRRSLTASLSSLIRCKSFSDVSALSSATSMRGSGPVPDHLYYTSNDGQQSPGQDGRNCIMEFAQSDQERRLMTGKRGRRVKEQVVVLTMQVRNAERLLNERIRLREETAKQLAKTKEVLASLQKALQEAEVANEQCKTENESLMQRQHELENRVQELQTSARKADAGLESERRSSQTLYANYIRMLFENEGLKNRLLQHLRRGEGRS